MVRTNESLSQSRQQVNESMVVASACYKRANANICFDPQFLIVPSAPPPGDIPPGIMILSGGTAWLLDLASPGSPGHYMNRFVKVPAFVPSDHNHLSRLVLRHSSTSIGNDPHVTVDTRPDAEFFLPNAAAEIELPSVVGGGADGRRGLRPDLKLLLSGLDQVGEIIRWDLSLMIASDRAPPKFL
jgi:hypothetical protein